MFFRITVELGKIKKKKSEGTDLHLPSLDGHSLLLRVYNWAVPSFETHQLEFDSTANSKWYPNTANYPLACAGLGDVAPADKLNLEKVNILTKGYSDCDDHISKYKAVGIM